MYAASLCITRIHAMHDERASRHRLARSSRQDGGGLYGFAHGAGSARARRRRNARGSFTTASRPAAGSGRGRVAADMRQGQLTPRRDFITHALPRLSHEIGTWKRACRTRCRGCRSSPIEPASPGRSPHLGRIDAKRPEPPDFLSRLQVTARAGPLCFNEDECTK